MSTSTIGVTLDALLLNRVRVVPRG